MRTCHRMVCCRSVRPEWTVTKGRRSSSSSATAPGGRRAGPTETPTITAREDGEGGEEGERSQARRPHLPRRLDGEPVGGGGVGHGPAAQYEVLGCDAAVDVPAGSTLATAAATCSR